MKSDAPARAKGLPATKRPSKETLNHRELIEIASGLDVCAHTAEAHRRVHQVLGTDMVHRAPLEYAPAATPVEIVRSHPHKECRSESTDGL